MAFGFADSSVTYEPKDEPRITPVVSAVVEYLSSMCARDGSVVLPDEGSREYEFYVFESITEEEMMEYLEKLLNVYSCSESELIMALAYLHRSEQANLGLKVNLFNVKLLFTIAFTLAVKFNEDLVYSNGYYSQQSGLPLDVLNRLEFCLFQSVGYHLNVTPEEFEQLQNCVFA
ncbi:hypothetical protein NDN08_004200 [Rhodosorus marinus]|uniref:Cyclin n=1 Tax=Rhodosorus marinus TaxID=101924 RepID=A0AAV8UHM4_9RHOD|nr:hypothetical protein NDN08_004200 [Rhodosorus marinus]